MKHRGILSGVNLSLALLLTVLQQAMAQSPSFEGEQVAAEPLSLEAQYVNVLNRPGVKVINTPRVHVVNVPDVNVINRLAVEIEPAEPLQWVENNVQMQAAESAAAFYVPDGRRLVIEFISAQAGVNDASVVGFDLYTTVNETTVQHRLVPVAVGPNGEFAQSYRVSEALRLYADAATEVRLVALKTPGGLGSFSASVSGYLVPMP